MRFVAKARRFLDPAHPMSDRDVANFLSECLAQFDAGPYEDACLEAMALVALCRGDALRASQIREFLQRRRALADADSRA